MAAAQLAAPPRQPPHGSTAPTSLAAPLAHNGLRFTCAAKRSGAASGASASYAALQPEY